MSVEDRLYRVLIKPSSGNWRLASIYADEFGREKPLSEAIEYCQKFNASAQWIVQVWDENNQYVIDIAESRTDTPGTMARLMRERREAKS